MRTDIRGIITYTNTTFCEISGYSREELIGQPHNIMRHPDMPTAGFANLWATLKAGKAWKGLIKNRCKDGGFFWVEANANPIVADGKIVGYMSLRTRPSAEQVHHAQQANASENSRSSDPHRALALVVDEVRSLSKRSRTASGGARHMMSEIIASLDRSVASLETCREQLDTIGEQSENVAQLLESNIGKAHAHADSAALIDSELLKLTRLSANGADLSS